MEGGRTHQPLRFMHPACRQSRSRQPATCPLEDGSTKPSLSSSVYSALNFGWVNFLHDATKHAPFKASCRRRFGELDALLWIWSAQELDP